MSIGKCFEPGLYKPGFRSAEIVYGISVFTQTTAFFAFVFSILQIIHVLRGICFPFVDCVNRIFGFIKT